MDLNCDLGEGFGSWRMGDDESLLSLVTSANVACGFHAGDPQTMWRTVALAVANGVAVGAHVGYPDLRGFGRRSMALGAEELRADVLYQIGALEAICASLGTRVSYVKAHGALYNDSAADRGLAALLVAAVAGYRARQPLAIVTLPGSEVAAAAEGAGLRCVQEGFADRSYEPDGSLSPRTRQGSVIGDPQVAAERAVRMATEGVVVTVAGSELTLGVETICVHGDSPGAVELAAAVRAGLQSAGVGLGSFAA